MLPIQLFFSKICHDTDAFLHLLQDLNRVVHYGRSKSVLDYWQEVGRVGRTAGSVATAILYPKGCIGVDKDIFVEIRKLDKWEIEKEEVVRKGGKAVEREREIKSHSLRSTRQKQNEGGRHPRAHESLWGAKRGEPRMDAIPQRHPNPADFYEGPHNVN